MCGIFASFNIKDQHNSEAELIAAIESVSHRGPDNCSHFTDGFCFVGHTRLSIVGIADSGNQPYVFEHLVMVYNGEIFNYIELREELRNLGYHFESESDTEVVLKAYHCWGGDCFERFNGMWSLVIYDQSDRSMLISRDRFGQKPLFILENQSTFYVASEIQQLAPLCNGDIDYGLIQMFLQEGGYDGQGRTFFNAIKEFPKAHYCRIDATGNIQTYRYWDYYKGKIQSVDEQSFIDFESLLKDAVKLRLRSDVPFGVLLSGGVDSTIIADYAEQFGPKQNPIPAFTYASNDHEDESKYAKAVADKLGMELTTREQEQDPQEFKARLRRLVQHLGRGHSSPAVISIDYLYESVAKKGIKVALDGQGADELLAGYKNYFILMIFVFLFKGQFKQALKCFKAQLKQGFISSVIMFLRNMLPPFAKSWMRRIYGYERFFTRYKATTEPLQVKKNDDGKTNASAFNRYLIEQHQLGLENLLYYGDIVAMNNSVENRSPFMDHRLVDFVFSRGDKLKLHDAKDKYVLRTLPAYQRFKAELERDKIGFSSDIKAETKGFMVKELRQSPILEWPIFTQSLRDVLAGDTFETAKYERLLFRLYQVHLWNDIFKLNKN